MLDLVGFVLNRKKSELDLTQDIQFLGFHLRLDLGEASLPESKAWEIVAHAHHLSSLLVQTYAQVSQLMGSLVRSDRTVYATASIRPSGPCQPSAALAGPTFSYLRNPNPHVSGGFHDFTDASTQGWGARMGDSQISGFWTLTDRKLHISCLELKAVVCALQH